MRKLSVLILAGFPLMVLCQQRDSLVHPLSKWSLRINPASFFEPLGGLHLGVETNLDRRGRFSIVSEYGYIFLNNARRSGNNGEEKNTNRLSGIETKQEFRAYLGQGRGRHLYFWAVELHWLSAGVDNSGWFGMGQPDASGLYPYFKYQDFRETSRETSLAAKFGGKFFADRPASLELFAGFGMIHRNIRHENAEGKLYQPDREALFSTDKRGVQPRFVFGTRLCFRLN